MATVFLVTGILAFARFGGGWRAFALRHPTPISACAAAAMSALALAEGISSVSELNAPADADFPLAAVALICVFPTVLVFCISFVAVSALIRVAAFAHATLTARWQAWTT
ncbi:MAG TPA: hypothetical protein VFC51_07330 [Chloroflexota bacterium]|nr:hypothetical protein [Chloroflexota bacterium]